MTYSPVVETAHGLVQGEERGGVLIYRGIPYGADCSSSMRFKAPLPAENWQGVRDCTRNGHLAVQAGEGGSISGSPGLGPYFSGGEPEKFGVFDEKQGEDCLVLNVLTPGADARKRPVMVYIHGGGFATGSGSIVLGADKMVLEQDVVLVGVNHRLNIFGYLYLGELDDEYRDSGMAGMLDLVLALQWVRDNIAAFGGDPGNVTVFGESGGGMKITTLMAMEKAKGLFHKAIVESGSQPAGLLSKEKAAENTLKLLSRLGISPKETDRIVDMPAGTLKHALQEQMGDLLAFTPVADGINLEYNAAGTFSASGFANDIPLMVGSSRDEVAVFLVPKEEITWENLRQKLLDSKGMFAARDGVFTEETIDRQISIFKEHAKPGDDPVHVYLSMLSMSSFLGGGAFYQALSKAQQGGAPVYHYAIEYDSILPFKPERRYAWHTADLPLQLRIVLDKGSEALSKELSAMFCAFARTGDPSTPEHKWPAFDTSERLTMLIDDVISVQADPWKELRQAINICPE